MHLHRLARVHCGTFLDAAVHHVGFTTVQGDVDGGACASAVRVDRHRGGIITRHHKQAHIFKHGVRAHIITHRGDVLGAVVHGRKHFIGTAKHRAGRGGPACPGNHQRLRAAETVATVIETVRWITRQRHLVPQHDDRARGEGRGIVCIPGRDAVGVVAISPDLRGGLGGIVQVDFIAILPMVIVKHRASTGGYDGDHRLQGVSHDARGRLDAHQSRLHLHFRQRNIELMDDICRP